MRPVTCAPAQAACSNAIELIIRKSFKADGVRDVICKNACRGSLQKFGELPGSIDRIRSQSRQSINGRMDLVRGPAARFSGLGAFFYKELISMGHTHAKTWSCKFLPTLSLMTILGMA